MAGQVGEQEVVAAEGGGDVGVDGRPSAAPSRAAGRVRTRLAWRYSTAGMVRPWRKMFGQACSSCRTIRSSRPLRVSSSKAAAASAVRMTRSASIGRSGSSIGWRSIPSLRSASRPPGRSRAAPPCLRRLGARRANGRSRAKPLPGPLDVEGPAASGTARSITVASLPSGPWMASKTSAQSSTLAADRAELVHAPGERHGAVRG